MIPNLQDLRKEIDDIDEQMTALFEKRMAIAEQVARFKIENKKPVLTETENWKNYSLCQKKPTVILTAAVFRNYINKLCPSAENANTSFFKNMEYFKKISLLLWKNWKKKM